MNDMQYFVDNDFKTDAPRMTIVINGNLLATKEPDQIFKSIQFWCEANGHDALNIGKWCKQESLAEEYTRKFEELRAQGKHLFDDGPQLLWFDDHIKECMVQKPFSVQIEDPDSGEYSVVERVLLHIRIRPNTTHMHWLVRDHSTPRISSASKLMGTISVLCIVVACGISVFSSCTGH